MKQSPIVSVTAAEFGGTTASVAKTTAAVTETTAAVAETTAAVTETTAAASSMEPAVAAGTAAAAAASGSCKDCGIPGSRIIGQDGYSRELCPLCQKFCKGFYCARCIKGRFIKKQILCKNIISSSTKFKNECAELSEKKQSIILKKVESAILEERIMLLKLAIAEKNKVVAEKENYLKKLNSDIDNQKSRVNRYGKRVVRLQAFTKNQLTVLDEKSNELMTVRPKLKSLVKQRVNQLSKYIFPLSEVHPTIQSEEEDANDSVSLELADASKMTYICGQWVNTCVEWSSQNELAFRIVAPTLPANGDYSAFYQWASDNNRDYAVSESNPAWNFSAALTYSLQFVKALSFFLNVYLFRRPHLSEFCGDDLNKNKFIKFVTNLNATVIYLCISQNVDLKLIHPEHTLRNLMQLLDTAVSDLGRLEPPDIDWQLCNKYAEQITLQLLSSSFGNSDSEDDNYYEWETVPNVQYSADHTQLALQSTSSVTRAGLVASTAASLASMWRGFTK